MTLSIEELEDRGIYRIYSRNLEFGVYSEKVKGFIGIREKFGQRYLFTEYHYEIGAPFGTVHPVELVGKVEDKRIQIKEVLDPSLCYFCGNIVKYEEYGEDEPRFENGNRISGFWKHISGDGNCSAEMPTAQTNVPLLRKLKEIEKSFENTKPDGILIK